MNRKLLIAALVVTVAGASATAATIARSSTSQGTAAPTALPPATAKVTRTTLVDTKKVSGTLGYGEAVPVGAAQPGTLTWIAPEGATVKRGQPLFKVDQRPVVALYGSVPLYRPLRTGVEGTDAKQFEKNLSKLGYAGFTVDDTYSAATATAAKGWQADLGLPETGAVEPGQVVVVPGAVRVAERTARVGDLLGGGPDAGAGGASVLSYTGTTRLVSVELEVADQALARKGRAVTVTVPGGASVKGKIAKVGTVATAPEPTGSAPGDQASGATSPTAADARIQVTVTLADQNKLGSLDAAPVDVDFVSQQRKGVLAVPVAALLALPDGGYGVQVVQDGATRMVPVRTGMFAAGKVEINGAGIRPGVTVGVPK